jgi:N-acetylmuramoyl-L-alanine amidase
LKIFIDAGHGGTDSGAVGKSSMEKDINLKIALKLQDKLSRSGIDIIMTRNSDVYVSLQKRCDMANNNNVDLYVEIHMNCFSDPAAKGTEVFCYTKNSVGKDYAQKVLNELLKIGWYNRGVKDGDWLYVIKHTAMTAILIETCFISNPNDMALYNPEKVANAIVMGLVGKLPEAKPEPKPPSNTETKITIMRYNKCTVEQMTTFLLKTNPNPKLNGMNSLDFCKLYLDESNKLGISGDIAFCQSIHETGWFKFGGLVLPEQNNYGG